METIRTVYTGELRTQSTHLKSGNQLITDAPVDNNGKGEAFSPSDLLCTSLGACMLTIMGMVADRHGINIRGTEIRVTKVMAANPRRVSEIHLEFDMPEISYSDKEKQLLENAAHTCPVRYSIHPDIEVKAAFNYR
jgi:putative redox protein